MMVVLSTIGRLIILVEPVYPRVLEYCLQCHSALCGTIHLGNEYYLWPEQGMPKRIAIDNAKPSDLPQIKMLVSELIQAMDDTGGIDVETALVNLREFMVDPNQHILVARRQAKILGLINFSIRKTIMHPGLSGLIDELVVSKSCRGSGIGKQLVLAAVEICRNLGCCEIEVSTEKDNARARRFYRAVGFDEDGVFLEMHL